MEALRKWFGDKSSETSETSDDTTGWEELDRTKANKIKRKRAKEARKIKEEQTLNKAAHILGIGPISEDQRMKHKNNKNDTKKATIDAVKDFLEKNLAFNSEELENLSITEVQDGKDEIIYVAFDNIDNIKEIIIRVSESGNTEILTRTYVPPQIFERFSYFNKVCKEMRQNDLTLKTQIRIGKHDLEILTKVRGTPDPFKKVDLDNIMDTGDAPKFDHMITWRNKPLHPTRRKISYPPLDPLAERTKNFHSLSRNKSTVTTQTKKAKLSQQESEDKMDSSSS